MIKACGGGRIANCRVIEVLADHDHSQCLSSAHGKADIAAEWDALKKINEKLWVVEDDIRDKERAKEFDAKFIELARAVYVINDERAAVKRQINTKLGSRIVEEKSYKDYK